MGRVLDFRGIKVEWLGHASVLLRSEAAVVYIDPYKVSHGDRADLVLITHGHYDHCDPASLSTLRKENTVVIAPKSCRDKVKGMTDISPGRSMERMGIRITAVPAYNLKKQFHPRGSGIGYVIEMSGVRIYHAGDTDSIPEMAGLGHIDIAFLPVGGTYTMDASEAADAASRIGAEITIPMHWGDVVGTRKDADEFARLFRGRADILD